VEAKEGVKVQSENVTYATITIQNYYRMYKKLSGMTGTASTESEEFDKIYKLEVLEIPTNLDYMASRPEWELNALQDVDDEGYKFTYYVQDGAENTHPAFWKRKDYPDVIYRTEEAKFRAIGQEILRFHALGRPILVGTTSVELSDQLSSRLKADPMRKLAQILILRSAWLEANNRELDGRAIPELDFLNRPLGLLPTAKIRKMAKDLDVNLNPLAEENLAALTRIIGLPPSYADAVGTILKNGVNHQVLNARKHTEESQIIADAGAFGAVTIATNMAGRGVDIKLGGELPEEILSTVSRILKRSGYDDPYDLTIEEREAILRQMDPGQYGIYEAEIEQFLNYMNESRQVKELGGLHVIGSERHDSRRIDNQLRGRAGRQGDPGSSRFYLSMQDQLMRLFGGQQAESMMERLRIDEDYPIELGMVTRIVEQSQTRVEGANFDTRKHLLEYDDVLNNQRATIYSQRDRIFTKDDLSDDVNEMLQTEIQRRVPEAMADQDGAWKMVAWMDQTQPSLVFGTNLLYPSFSLKLLLDNLKSQELDSPEKVFQAMMGVAQNAMEAEKDHLLASIDATLDRTVQQLEDQLKERVDLLDIFIEGIDPADEEDTRSARDLSNELIALLRVPLKMSSQDERTLQRDPEAIADVLESQIESHLTEQALKRIIAIVERRLEESLDVDLSEVNLASIDQVGDDILQFIEKAFLRRIERYIGDEQEGSIARDVRGMLENVKGAVNDALLINLLLRIPQGQRAVFHRKTRKRGWQRTTRLTYIYSAAQFLADLEEGDLVDLAFKHLDGAQKIMRRGLGMTEFARLAEYSPESLPGNYRRVIRKALGDELYEKVKSTLLKKFDPETSMTAAEGIGRIVLTETYRQLLLSVIGNLWIDYLTQMEALRVSVGLEAYAQRDPLVTYKAKASELFQTLIQDTRKGVVSRMFTYRIQPPTPRVDDSDNGTGAAPPPSEESASPAGVPALQEEQGSKQDPDASTSKKRRRRRKKR
jgi:preprotein translocase subunit SecA